MLHSQSRQPKVRRTYNGSFEAQERQNQIKAWEKTHKTSSVETRFTQHYRCSNTQELFRSLTKIFPNIEAAKIEQAIYQDNKYYHKKAGINWPPDDGKCHNEAHNFCNENLAEPAKEYLTKVVKSLTNNPFESFETPKLQELSIRLAGIDKIVDERKAELNKAIEKFPNEITEEEINKAFEKLKEVLTLQSK